MKNPWFKIKNGVITILKSGLFEISSPDANVVVFKNGSKVTLKGKPTDGPMCPGCKNTGRIFVDYGHCGHKDCPPDAHRGYEDCEVCNLRTLRSIR